MILEIHKGKVAWYYDAEQYGKGLHFEESKLRN